MKEISDELTQLPAGKTLQKALQAVAGRPAMSHVLFDLQSELLSRIKSRKTAFTPCDEALAAYAAAQEEPHIISLARSHSWYTPALQTGFKLDRDYTVDDLRREAQKQLQIRQGITAEDGQFDVIGFSTIALSRAIIRTTKPDSAILGNAIAWDGYAMPPAMEQREFQTKPPEQSWGEYIAQNFSDPKKQLGMIVITTPDSITGRYTEPAVLKELFEIADKYDVKVVLNQIHAIPDRDGKLPLQAKMIAECKSPNLLVMSAATKQLMPDGLPEMKDMMFNTFYSPSPQFVADVKREISNTLPASLKGEIITKRIIGPATQLMKASTADFYAANEQKSSLRREMVDNWLQAQDGMGWYQGQKPETIYHGVITFDSGMAAKAGIRNPDDLYNYVLFTTGLDIGPIYDKGPDGDYSKGGISMRLNYSLPEKQLRLSLDLLGIAAEKIRQGVTLDQAFDTAMRANSVKLKVDNTVPAPAPATPKLG